MRRARPCGGISACSRLDLPRGGADPRAGRDRGAQPGVRSRRSVLNPFCTFSTWSIHITGLNHHEASHSFMKGLFDSALGDVMGNIISDLGHELSDDVQAPEPPGVPAPSTPTVRGASSSTSSRGRWTPSRTAVAPRARPTPGRCSVASTPTRPARSTSTSSSALVRCLRSGARLDHMPGHLPLGGVLMNQQSNPELARRLLSKPYEPWSVLARAIAKPTRVVASATNVVSNGDAREPSGKAADAMCADSDSNDSGDSGSDRDSDSALEDPGGGGERTRGHAHSPRVSQTPHFHFHRLLLQKNVRKPRERSVRRVARGSTARVPRARVRPPRQVPPVRGGGRRGRARRGSGPPVGGSRRRTRRDRRWRRTW